MRTSSAVVYVARYPWLFRLFSVAGAILFATLRPSVAETWRSEGWFFGVGLTCVYVLIAAAVLETFVRKTTFTREGVYHRSMVGITQRLAYTDIRELIIRRGEALVIKSDRGSLKIHAKEGSPEAIIEAARPYLNPDIRVVTT